MSKQAIDAKEPESAPKLPSVFRRSFGDCFDASLSGILMVAILVGVFATWAFATSYVPSIEDSHASVVYASESNPISATIRGIIWFSHAFTFIAAFGLLLLRVWRRSFAKGMRARWFWVALAFALFVPWSFFWQLLPMDQAAWHGTLARKGVIEALPMGEAISAWLFPSGSISQGTLSLFASLALGVFPALMLFVTLGLWKSKSKSRPGYVSIGLLVGITLIVAGALLVPSVAALETSVRPEFSDVRPEWFFLPQSKALALTSGESIPLWFATGVSVAPMLLLFFAFVWPLIAGRWQWQFDRAAVIVVGFGYVALLGLGLGADFDRDEGYFAKPDLERTMLDLDALNQEMGSDGAIRADRVYPSIADLLILSDACTEIGPLSDEVKDPVKWAEMSAKTREAALAIWRTSPNNPTALEQAVMNLRSTCETCHEAYEEEIEVRRFEETSKPETIKPIDPEVIDPASDFKGFDAEALAGLKPLLPAPTAFADDDAFEAYMKELQRLVKKICESEAPDSLQDLVDLRAWNAPMALKQAAIRQYVFEEGMFLMEDEAEMEESWQSHVKAVNDGIERALSAKTREEWRSGVALMRDSCHACHDGFGFKEGKIKVPAAPAKR